jgi:hypothetical protein
MKTFEQHIADGTNNTLACLEALAAENPRFAKAGEILDALENINKQTVTTNPAIRIRKAIDNLNRHGGKLDVEIVHPPHLTEYQQQRVRQVERERLNPPRRDINLEFAPDGTLINPFASKPKTYAGQTRYKDVAIGMSIDVF